jgi:hypothetical protein
MNTKRARARRLLPFLLAFAACQGAAEAGDADAAMGIPDGSSPRTSSAYSVRPTVNQIYLWDASPGTVFDVLAPGGSIAASAPADGLGSIVFRTLTAGEGYYVRPADTPDDWTGPLRVWSVDDSLPDPSFYAGQPWRSASP